MRIPFFRTIKSFVVSAVTAATLTFAVLTAGTILDAHHQAWQEHHSPYYGEFEYYSTLYLGSWRVKLIEQGYDPEGIILSSLHWLQGVPYRRILEKIPESDGEREIWQYRIMLLPEHYLIDYKRRKNPETDQSADIRTLIPEMVSLIEVVASKDIASPYQNQVWKFEMASNVMRFFDYGRRIQTARERYDNGQRLFLSGKKLIKGVRVSNFENTYRFYRAYSPLLFAYQLYVLGNKLIFQKENLLMCKAEQTKQFVLLNNEIIPFWQNEYAKQGIVFAEEIDKPDPSYSPEELYQHAYQQRSKEIRKLFKEQCGIELR